MAWSDYLNEEAYRRFFEKPRFERATEPPRDRFREVERAGMAEYEATQARRREWGEQRERERPAVKPLREVERRVEPSLPATPQMEEHQYVNEMVQRYQRGEINYETLVDLVQGTVSRPGGVHGVLGKYGPDVGPYRGEGGLKERAVHVATPFTTPATAYLPPEARAPFEAIEKLPGGEVVAPRLEYLLSPAGLFFLATMPALTARMEAYGAGLGVAGKGVEKAGIHPEVEIGPTTWGPSGVAEMGGTVLGPPVGPALERAALRGAKALPGAARGVAAKGERIIPGVRQVMMEETGGLKPRPGPKMVLTNDIRTPMEINKRLNELTKLPRLTKAQKAERIRLYAEKDLNELRAAGTVDDQMDRLLADIKEMGEELELRAVSREYKPAQAPQFGDRRRADWLAERAGRPHGVRPKTQFSNEPTDVLEGRLKTYQEFADNMKVEPVKPGEEHLVSRARFTERGEVIKEPTFATEGELAGVRPQQAELGIGAGERPIETAGPMFEKAVRVQQLPAYTGKAYRVPSGFTQKPGATAGDVVRFEQTELGNKLGVSDELLAELDKFPAKDIKWITTSRREAARYGPAKEIEEVSFVSGRTVADIGPEGKLVLEARPAPKPAAQAFREATEARRPGAPTREEALGRWRGGYEKPAAAPEAARAGVQPPREPPTRPPTAEAVPPIPGEDPVPKLIQLIKKAKPVRKETEALKTQVRRKQAAAMGKIFERHPGEAPYRAKGVLKGELPSAAFEPPMNLLSEAEMSQLRRQIRTFFEREGGRAFDELGAREALEGILGGKQPTWGEIGTLQAIFGRKLGAALEGKMPPMKRIAREALEIWNLGRTFKASIDQSWHLRQGIRLGPRHIKESVREGIRGMKGLWSQQTYEDSVRFITRGQEQGRMSPNLFAGRVGPGATTMERTEAYISKYSDVIPVVKHTAREYATSGNFVRGAINENMNRTWTQRLGRKLTEQEMEWTGRVCNWGLGRGPLPDDFRGLLAGIFFAPGYRTAGPAYYSLLINPKTPGFVRRMVAEELVAWVGTGVGLLTVLELSGVADVEGIDIRKPGRVSSDFGKIRVGDMRFDIWGGSQQQVRAVLGLITGERKTLSTGEIMDVSRKEVVSRYIESGYQPSMGLATSIWTGTDWEGKPLTPGGSIQDLFAPMAVEDIVEAVREEGAKGWIAAPFVHLGVGVWTPDLAGVKVNELTQRYDEEGRHKNEMSSVEFERLAEEYPDLAKARQDQVDEAAMRGSDWAKFTQKRETADAEFEKGLKDALLNPKGRTWEQMGRELDDHAYEWAIRSDEFYGELDIDPRDDLDRRINAYYAIEMPAFATEEEKSGFFRQREEMLRADPDLAGAIHDHKVLRFVDSDVRRFVDLKWQAGLVANEYYSIPYKSRMPAEQQEQVSQYVTQAEAIARMKNLPFRRALMQASIPQELMGLALRYKNLSTNPARERYWRQHPESEELYRAFYGPIPLEIPLGIEQPEMAMAGVP